jgi:DNA mismatch repair protein MSH6
MNDPNYDPSTLYVPESDMEKFTPTMKVYWHMKIENYDKILFFKLGKFYEMFYEDAIIC